MDDVNAWINRGRELYREGHGSEAYRVFQRVAEAIDSRVAPLESPAFVNAIDAANMMALSLLEAGEREKGRSILEELQPRLFPDVDDLVAVLGVFSDPEQGSMFVFGQLKLVEIAADELDPPRSIIDLFSTLEPLVQAADNRLLCEYAASLRARIKRLLGQCVQAVDDWLLNSFRISAYSRERNVLPSGYPASRSLCEALLTLEIIAPASPRISRLISSTSDFDVWDEAILAGITQRHQPETHSELQHRTSDPELSRTSCDAWFCGQVAPDDRSARALLEALTDAPLACRLTYPWRAARSLALRGIRPPAPLLHHVTNMLSKLDPELRADYGLPARVSCVLDEPATALARCLAI